MEEKKTKKDRILELFAAGVRDIDELAELSRTRSSYVASVLQSSGQLAGYFDLYTNSAQAMNVYSKHFTGKVGFRDEEAARNGVGIIDSAYRRFEMMKDRPGQHHALMLALTMCDRARWSGKVREAAIYRAWLIAKLHDTNLGRPRILDALKPVSVAS